MASTSTGDYQNYFGNAWVPHTGSPEYYKHPSWIPQPAEADFVPGWVKKLQEQHPSQPLPAFPSTPPVIKPFQTPMPDYQSEDIAELIKKLTDQHIAEKHLKGEKAIPAALAKSKPSPVDVVFAIKESLYALLGKGFCEEHLQVLDNNSSKPVFGLPFLPASKTALHDRIADLTDTALTKFGAYVIFKYDSSVVLKAFGINESLSGFICSKQLMATLRAIPVHQSSSVLVLAQYAGAVSVDKERVKGEFRTVLEVELALKEALPRRQILRLVSPFDTPDCEVALTITLPDGTKEQVSPATHRRIIL